MKIVYADAAKEDIRSIAAYIQEVLHNGAAARDTVQVILRGCMVLQEQPHIGMSVRKRLGIDLDLSCVVIGKYLVFYHIVDQIVIVVRVIDSRTDYVQKLVGLLK